MGKAFNRIRAALEDVQAWIDAAYIAAAHPGVIIELLDALEKAERER